MNEAKFLVDDTTESNQEWRKLRYLLKEFERLILCPENAQAIPKRIKVFSHLNTKEQFLSLPLEFQKKAVLAFRFYVETFATILKEGDSPKNSKKFLWRALQSLGLIPVDNLFDHIEDDDIIEVYSSEGIQVFRSFSFLEPISYTIEDLIVFPWHDLFKREEKTTELLIDQAIRLFNREIDHTQPNEINYDHMVIESMSAERKSLNTRFGVVSPIKSKAPSSISYFATTFKIFQPKEESNVLTLNPISPSL